MSPAPIRPARTAFISAAVVACVAMLAVTAILAIASHPAKAAPPTVAVSHKASSVLALIQGVTPPPGAALLLIVGLLAARRGYR